VIISLSRLLALGPWNERNRVRHRPVLPDDVPLYIGLQLWTYYAPGFSFLCLWRIPCIMSCQHIPECRRNCSWAAHLSLTCSSICRGSGQLIRILRKNPRLRPDYLQSTFSRLLALSAPRVSTRTSILRAISSRTTCEPTVPVPLTTRIFSCRFLLWIQDDLVRSFCDSADCLSVEHIVRLSVAAPLETGCQVIDFLPGDSSLGQALP